MANIKTEHVIEVASIIVPLLKQAEAQADEQGLTGDERKRFISQVLKTTYTLVQKSGSVPAMGFVPWEAVAPLIVPVVDGSFSLLGGLFRQLGIVPNDTSEIPIPNDLLPTPEGISVTKNTVIIGSESHVVSFSPDGEKVYFNTK